MLCRRLDRARESFAGKEQRGCYGSFIHLLMEIEELAVAAVDTPLIRVGHNVNHVNLRDGVRILGRGFRA